MSPSSSGSDSSGAARSRSTARASGSSRCSSARARWAYLCYAGLWWEPLRGDLDAYMDSANERVTGEVTVKLYKGSASPVARSSPYALYDRALAGFGESGGEFSQAASPGFIELFTLQSRMAHRLRDRVEGEG